MLKGFFSYAPEDRREATAFKNGVSKHLQILGVDVLLWDEDLVGIGHNLEDCVLQNIEESHFSILMISPDYLSNQYLMHNLVQKLQAKQQKEKRFLLMPILLKPCHVNTVEIFRSLRCFAPRGDLFGRNEKQISYSLVLKEGSPLKDEYHNYLAEQLLNSLKHVKKNEKDRVEELVSENHPHEELIKYLVDEKANLIKQICKVIPIMFAQIENDFALELEAKWLIEIMIARIVTQKDNAYKAYLSEERFLPIEIYPSMIKQVPVFLPSGIPHRAILDEIVNGLAIKLESLVNRAN